MQLTTYFTINPTWSEEDKTRQVEYLIKTVRAFADMDNCAFWDAKSVRHIHCVAVYGFAETIQEANYIKSDDIEKEVRDWCNYLKGWCNDDPDTNLDDERFVRKELRVEIMDCDYDGGLFIKTYNKDNELENTLCILPLRNTPVVPDIPLVMAEWHNILAPKKEGGAE